MNATPTQRSAGRERIEGVYPLSPIQEGILFHAVYEPQPGLYVSQLSCDLAGELSEATLRQAWQSVVDRHSILRTAFVWEGVEHPMQVVLRQVTVPLRVEALSELDPDAREARIRELHESELKAGFDLTRAPLMRVLLLHGPAGMHLLWTFHHLILDGWSEPLVVDELARLYEAHARGDALPPAVPGYDAYLAWLRQRDLTATEAFWRRELAGIEPAPRLGGDAAALAGPPDMRIASVGFPDAGYRSLRELAGRLGLTLSTVVLGAWAMVLSRALGRDDLVVGLTVSGRPAGVAGIERIVGPLINTLPARIAFDPGAGAVPWLQRLQGRMAELRQHEFSPLVEVQRWSGLPPGATLFETLFVFQNAPAGLSQGLLRPGGSDVEVGSMRFRGALTNYPLSLEVDPGESLTLMVTFDRRRLPRVKAEALLADLGLALSALSEEPEAELGALRERVGAAAKERERESGRHLAALNTRKLKTAKRRAVAPATTESQR